METAELILFIMKFRKGDGRLRPLGGKNGRLRTPEVVEIVLSRVSVVQGGTDLGREEAQPTPYEPPKDLSPAVKV
jgi:hypothetical protein